MKKFGWMSLLVLVLTLALAGSALAATTGLAVDGKVYTFSGDLTSFEADGKTFIIEGDTIRIQELGKADRVLPMESGEEMMLAQDIAAPGVASESAYAPGTEWADEAAEVISEYGDTFAIVADAVAFEAISEAEMALGSTQIYDGSAYGQNQGYDDYAQFGLSYDAKEDALYYQGQRVRIFEDAYLLEANGSIAIAIEHFDPAGVVDVKAERDLSNRVYNDDGSYDPSGVLTGLRRLTDAEFAARDLTSWTSPERQMTAVASEGDPMTPAEKQALYAPYATLGIDYDAAADRLSYQGQSIRRFLDVRQSNGESFSSGRFKGSMTSMSYDDGEIDVTILRDYTQPDAEGNGTITGVHTENVK